MEHTKGESYKEKFFQFLEEKGVKDKFMFNLYNNPTGVGIEGLEREENNPEQYMSVAFMWKQTPEGEDFWRDLHEDWQSELLKTKKSMNHDNKA